MVLVWRGGKTVADGIHADVDTRTTPNCFTE